MKKIGLILLFIFILSANALATDYYVKTPANGGIDGNDGLSWATAKATITAAMALVNGSDNIHVAAGSYNERVSFHASNTNQLLGGYPAAGEGTRAPWTNQTIISGTGLTGSVISIPGNFTTSVGYSGIVIDGFTIRNGSKSTAYGAGIESYSVGLTIKDCIVESNTSTGSAWVGGIYAMALLNELSTRLLRIESCIIRNNTGPGAGGILIDAIAPFQLQLVNNLINGNSSTDTASFLFGTGGVVIGTGSQMMASPPNNPKIINCTIADNTAAHTTKKVGGIGVNLSFGETVTIANSIIWHAGAGTDDIYAYNGETTSISYSDVRDPADPGESGTGVIHSDPSFVGVSDYRLNAGSPCIDTGSNSVSGIPSTDLVGNPRIADGDGNGSTIADMGAYEKTTPPDTTPDAFAFTDQTGVPLSTLTESNSVTVSGIAAPASISITGGEYRIGAGSYTSAPGTVSNGETVTVRQTSSGSFSTTTNATLTIGGMSDTFSLTTLDDTAPNAFTFTDQTEVPLNTLRESNTITVSGITGPASISITGGEYKIEAGTYTSAPGTVSNGNTVSVRQTSSASFSTTTNTTLTIGGVSDTFSLTTLDNIPPDTTPDAFIFTDQTGVSLNSLRESNAITVAGITAPAAISITGGEYKIGAGTYTSAPGTVNNGNTVRVRQTSSASFSTTTNTTLTIGGVSDTFSLTTLDNTYDGNGDGIPDYQQPNVASVNTFGGLDLVTLASPNGTTLANVQAKDNPSLGDSPSGVSFPYGFFDFTVNGLTPGGATTVTLYLPAGAAPNTYYKYGPTPGNTTPHWYEFLYDGQTGAEIAGNVIILHFVDGLRGDDDLTADGIIIDQGGPGLKLEGHTLYLPLIRR